MPGVASGARARAGPKAPWPFGLDAFGVVSGFLVLYAMGYGGHALWWCLAVGALAGVQQVPRVQLRLAGGDLRNRRVPRLVLLMVTAAAFIYPTGWGPVLLGGFGLVVALHVRLSGSQAWRHGVAWSIGCAVAGQLGIAAGWLPTYVPVPAAHGVALICLLLGVLSARTIGLAVEERESVEADRTAAQLRVAALLRDSGVMIAIISVDGLVEYLSPSARQLVGIDPEAVIGASFLAAVHPDDRETVQQNVASATRGDEKPVWRQMRVRRADGSFWWAEACVRDLTDDPDVRGYVATIRDVHERKLSEEQLVYRASHDALTGLVNRAEFGRILNDATERGYPAVLFVDLDGFKQVNDAFGHEMGDVLLVAAAAVLRAATPASGVVGRFGGDEFGVVLPDTAGADAAAVARRILERMLTPVPTECGDLRLRASVGVAVTAPGEPARAGELLRRADLAMYEAKRAGTHLFRVAAADPVRLGVE